MRALSLATLLVIPFAGAQNDYLDDWENTIPNCVPKQCGKEGECPEFEICTERGSIEVCQPVWQHRFCDRECRQLLGGSQRMVPNPRRYCECIAEDLLIDSFCEEPPLDPLPCICPAIYAPVTCEDGVEYSNSCSAGCAGQQKCEAVSFGQPDFEESDDCICTKEYAPVVCEDGIEYSNQCIADCAGQSKCLSTAEPEESDDDEPCICTREYDPVQCEDGNEYSNQCVAECAGQEECSSPKIFYNQSFFADLVNFYDNDYNRPTGLGVNIPIGRRKGGYVDLITEYSEENNRQTDDEVDEPDNQEFNASIENLSSHEKLTALLFGYAR